MKSILRNIFTRGRSTAPINNDLDNVVNHYDSSGRNLHNDSQMNILKQKPLTDLPEYLYYTFQDYLTQDDYQQLLNTSKRIFTYIRRKTIVYRLPRKYSIQYCEDRNFRNQLIEKVENPFKQIIIKLDYYKIKCYEEVFNHCPVHVICTSFSILTQSNSLQNIKEFSLHCFPHYFFNITSLLNISQCEKVALKDYSRSDISSLEDCKHVILNSCENVTDFSSLGKQTSLCIYENAHLTNVMSFRSIQTLTLKKCRNLQDISPLRGVYDLSLIQCWAITDLSSLGGHHRLEITWCSQILSGYHALKDIPIVKLVGCKISDVSVLSNSKILYLEGCGSLVDVSSLRGVRDLTLRDCTKIEDISMLTTIQKLTLDNLPELKSYEGVNEIPNLYLQISDLNDGMLLRFPNVKNIESSFFLLRDILPLLPFFTNLHSLTVRYVSPVIIEVCIDIHTVILEKCDIKNIRGLGKNRVVRLFECRGDGIDVTCLATVPLVSIINCRFKNVNYERLLNVPRLKIEDWVDDH